MTPEEKQSNKERRSFRSKIRNLLVKKGLVEMVMFRAGLEEMEDSRMSLTKQEGLDEIDQITEQYKRFLVSGDDTFMLSVQY